MSSNKTLITDQIDTDELDRRKVFFIPIIDVNDCETENTSIKNIMKYLLSKKYKISIEHKPLPPCGRLTIIQKI